MIGALVFSSVFINCVRDFLVERGSGVLHETHFFGQDIERAFYRFVEWYGAQSGCVFFGGDDIVLHAFHRMELRGDFV